MPPENRRDDVGGDDRRRIAAEGIVSEIPKFCFVVARDVTPRNDMLSAAWQWKPWQRPCMARVLRRSASSVVAGISAQSASRTSPSETRSQ
jgi:hypothetical protein